MTKHTIITGPAVITFTGGEEFQCCVTETDASVTISLAEQPKKPNPKTSDSITIPFGPMMLTAKGKKFFAKAGAKIQPKPAPKKFGSLRLPRRRDGGQQSRSE